MAATLPQPPDVASTLSDLLGKSVVVKRATAPLQPGPRVPVTVAVYGTEPDEPRILWVCNLAIGCALGAALSLIPAGVAAESARRGQMEEGLRENLHEVMNVAATVLSSSGNRMVLQSLHVPPTPLPAGVARIVARPARRLNLELTVPGYPPGKVALLTA